MNIVGRRNFKVRHCVSRGSELSNEGLGLRVQGGDLKSGELRALNTTCAETPALGPHDDRVDHIHSSLCFLISEDLI